MRSYLFVLTFYRPGVKIKSFDTSWLFAAVDNDDFETDADIQVKW